MDRALSVGLRSPALLTLSSDRIQAGMEVSRLMCS